MKHIHENKHNRCVLIASHVFHSLIQVFTSTSTIVFKTFACDEEAVVGESYLRADYSLSCDSAVHTWFMVYAGIMILVSKHTALHAAPTDVTSNRSAEAIAVSVIVGVDCAPLVLLPKLMPLIIAFSPLTVAPISPEYLPAP